MEHTIVELKKLKITKSILSQSLYASIVNMLNTDVLGWIMFKSGKYWRKLIVFYHKDKKTILLKDYPTKMEVVPSSDGKGGVIYSVVYKYDRGSSIYRETDDGTKEEADKLLDKLLKMKETVDNKGQIYY